MIRKVSVAQMAKDMRVSRKKVFKFFKEVFPNATYDASTDIVTVELPAELVRLMNEPIKKGDKLVDFVTGKPVKNPLD